MNVPRQARHAWVATVGLLLLLSSAHSTAAEDQQDTLTAAEERIVQRLKEEIIKELQEGEILQQQIEIGIRNFVAEQQKAAVKAREQQRARAAELTKNIRPVSAERDHIKGNPDAEVTLVEYSDFECPYCKRFHVTAERLVQTYNGKVNWVYRHFPLSFHNPGAFKQAEASECASALAGNDMFWKYTDTIYDRTSSGGRGFGVQKLIPLAVELGIDELQFKECLDSGRYTARVQEDFDEGARIGIRGTPGNVLINSRTGTIVSRSGNQPFEKFKADIDKLLAEAQ